MIWISIIVSVTLFLLQLLMKKSARGASFSDRERSQMVRLLTVTRALEMYVGEKFGIGPNISISAYQGVLDEAGHARKPLLPRVFGVKAKNRKKA